MLSTDPTARAIQRHVAREAMRRYPIGGKKPRDRVKSPCRRAAMAAALNQARNDKNLLRRSLTTHPPAADVLARLEGCHPGRPCGSAACAGCTTATSRAMAPLFSDLINRHPGPWFYVTIIQTRRTIPQGALARHRLFDRFEIELHRFFAEQNAIAIGTLEISCNEHHAGAHEPRYVEHAHIFTPHRITPAVRRRLLEIFPRIRGVKRPLKVRPYDLNDDAIDYGLKTHVVRRIQLPPTRPDGTRTIFSTRKRRLRGPQRVEVAISMNRRAATDQLFVHGIRVVETRNGACLQADDHRDR